MKSFTRIAAVWLVCAMAILTIVCTNPGCAAKLPEAEISRAEVSAGRVDKTFELQASVIDQLRGYVASGGRVLIDTLDGLNHAGIIDSQKLAGALGRAQVEAIKARKFRERETARADKAESSPGYRIEQRLRHYVFLAKVIAWSAVGLTVVAAVGSRFIGGVPGMVLSAIWAFVKHVVSGGATTAAALARERALLNSYIDRGSAGGGVA